MYHFFIFLLSTFQVELKSCLSKIAGTFLFIKPNKHKSIIMLHKIAQRATYKQ